MTWLNLLFISQTIKNDRHCQGELPSFYAFKVWLFLLERRMTYAERRIYLPLFFLPRLEGFQPALLITHLGTLQASDSFVTVTRVTKYIAIILLMNLGEVWKSFYLLFSYTESRLRTSSLKIFYSSTGSQGIWAQMNLFPKQTETLW